ncbi:MAG: glutamate--tRNA ligase family protein [Verrucomicrobiota bacterium]|nr:glutamate--tRNA ligase family protein [Verrucomicrobiota bacterium]
MMTTRFAPSLTGYLHLGHVLHMLYVWGTAKAKGAEVACRIEDHDRGRARPEYETAILENMEWLGFVPDLGITASTAAHPSEYRQSDCSGHYAAVLQTLEKRGLVYGCECSRRQIVETQPVGAEELCYSGICSDKGLPLEGNTVRFRTLEGETVFQDLELGECRQTPCDQCGDFSLRDRTGQWTYQFCCACDDIRQGIDLVVRGADILSSTARQIQLFQALGNPAPRYFHHPLLCDEKGRKLSKRQRSESIAQLREVAAAPEQIIGQAIFEANLSPVNDPVPLDEAIQRYIV